MDYGGFYDLKKLTMKKLENVSYVGAMNPTAGSFFIIDRMQRHFATMATPFPETEVLRNIYTCIMEGHLQVFNQEMRDALPAVINAAVGTHQAIADALTPPLPFTPTPTLYPSPSPSPSPYPYPYPYPYP